MAKTYLNIKLEDGKTIKFRKDNIKVRALIEVSEVQQKILELGDADNFGEQIKTIVDFLVGFFKDDRLTEELILDNVESDEILPEFRRLCGDVLGVSTDDGDEPGES